MSRIYFDEAIFSLEKTIQLFTNRPKQWIAWYLVRHFCCLKKTLHHQSIWFSITSMIKSTSNTVEYWLNSETNAFFFPFAFFFRRSSTRLTVSNPFDDSIQVTRYATQLRIIWCWWLFVCSFSSLFFVAFFLILFQSHTTNIIIEKRFRNGTRCVEVIVLKTEEVLKIVFSLMFFLSIGVLIVCSDWFSALALHACSVFPSFMSNKKQVNQRESANNWSVMNAVIFHCEWYALLYSCA